MSTPSYTINPLPEADLLKINPKLVKNYLQFPTLDTGHQINQIPVTFHLFELERVQIILQSNWLIHHGKIAQT